MHQQLLRSMDALMDHQEAVDDVVADLLRPLIDQDLSLVFYDLTTIRAAGLTEQSDDVRRYGMAKSGLIKHQFMLGVVHTAEGLPIYHEVFDGNQAVPHVVVHAQEGTRALCPHQAPDRGGRPGLAVVGQRR
jgi:hypothetical protein